MATGKTGSHGMECLADSQCWAWAQGDFLVIGLCAPGGRALRRTKMPPNDHLRRVPPLRTAAAFLDVVLGPDGALSFGDEQYMNTPFFSCLLPLQW